jgi:hypothetical protein
MNVYTNGGLQVDILPSVGTLPGRYMCTILGAPVKIASATGAMIEEDTNVTCQRIDLVTVQRNQAWHL